MRYAFQVDGKPISLAQAIKLRNLLPFGLLWCNLNTTFTDTVKSQWSYKQTLESDYAVRSIDELIKHIVEDIIFSYFLAANSRATNIPYITLSKMMIKHYGVLTLLGKLARTLHRQRLLASRTLMTRASTHLLWRISSSRIRLLTHLSGTTTGLPSPTRVTSMHTTEHSLMCCSLGSWTKTMSSFRPLCYFSTSTFNEPN